MTVTGTRHRFDRLAKFFRKLIPETRWGMVEREVVHFHRGI